MKKYILSLDLGTTSVRAILFNKKGFLVGIEQKEFTQHFPHPGWVEHDANEIWLTVLSVISNLLISKEIDIQEIDSIGITNQRETTVVWDKETGLPIYHAIVWQSRQSSPLCVQLKQQGKESFFLNKTGLPIDAYFSATKIQWILSNVPHAKEKAFHGKLLFGTIDTWIIWKLSGGKDHVTDYSNASRTLLYNIFTLSWDQDILSLLEIPYSMLPQVKPSSGYFSTTDPALFFGKEIPITAVAGDQHAALFGQTCFEPGIVKNTYGTGCFLLMNTGNKPIKSKKGLLTTIAWGIDDQVEYALEGSIFVAGSAVQWLRDGLEFFEKASDSELYAEKISDAGGVVVVPAFVGLGSPYWDQDVRGAILGITHHTRKEEIIRATLESICYQTKDVLDVMCQESGYPLKGLRVDGGISKNAMVMQFQSDLLNISVDVPQITEITALGIAYMAGLSTGFWKSKEEIQRLWHIEKSYRPQFSDQQRKQSYQKWKKAVHAAMQFKD